MRWTPAHFTLAALPAPAWVFHRKTLRLVEVNDAAVDLYGYTRDQLLAMTVTQLRAAEDSERPPRRAGAPTSEARHVTSEGRIVDVLLRETTVREHGDEFVLVVAHDLTERKRAEAALRRNDRLASLGTLVAGVAHEINNPLTFAMGNVDLAEFTLDELRTTDDPAERQRLVAELRGHLGVTRSGLERIESIVKGLGQVSRRERGPATAVDLAEVIRGVATVAAPRFDIRTTVRYEVGEAPRIWANEASTNVLVLNLLLNAADAVRGRPDGRVRVGLETIGEQVRLSVSDNGPGIPEAAQDRVFTPFFTTKNEGTGLGLSISRSIAESVGGSLTFVSTPNGTTFFLDLPAHAPKMPAT